MKKIKLLVLPSDRAGVGRYRSVDPHVNLQNNYPEDFQIDIDYEPKMDDENYWKKYDIVHFHRSIGQDFDQCLKILENLKKWGIITVGDIDDYWLPTPNPSVDSFN